VTLYCWPVNSSKIGVCIELFHQTMNINMCKKFGLGHSVFAWWPATYSHTRSSQNLKSKDTILEDLVKLALLALGGSQSCTPGCTPVPLTATFEHQLHYLCYYWLQILATYRNDYSKKKKKKKSNRIH